MRDPFHEQIIEALEAKRFDPAVFESCTCDLLRDTFPGLVPIHGGSDAGMDGAIADGKAEPYPLVCTTGEDVIGNLTESLESYVSKGGERHKVVLATSQALTPPQRRNLEARAREKGFTLVQTIEQRGIADRLYRCPRWSKELLGLSGAPPALSALPRSRRPLIEIELIGREADVAWLHETSSDRLIVGEPGSGKTYLLRHLVREGKGLFLNSDDRTEIANALREQRPEVVIVDDAHSRLEDLATLRHLREEMGLDVAIAATSWKGDRDAVASALGNLETAKTRQLELLTRDQILEIIKQAGVETTDELLRELVDQAANKPGLAVTLAQLWLRGDWREVLTGQALRRSLLPMLEPLVGEEATPVLAALGLGGDSGIALADAAAFLSLSPVKMRTIATGLSAGGVLGETSYGLAVWPRRLRSALLGEVFFSDSATAFDYRQLLARVPDLTSAVAALVEARHSLIDVPIEELRELVAQYGSPTVWRSFAALRRAEATWVLENYLKYQPPPEADRRRATEFYPRRLTDIAAEALEQASAATIPRLLELAAEERPNDLHQSERTLGCLRRWIEAWPSQESSSDLIERRRQLLSLSKRFLAQGGDRSVGADALVLVVSPKCERVSQDPGGGRTVTHHQGLLAEEAIEKIVAFWPEIRSAMGEVDAHSWRALKRALWPWIFPQTVAPGAEIAPEQSLQMRGFAASVLTNLATQTHSRPGFAAGLKRLARRLGLELEVNADSTFELLYQEPPGNLEDVPTQRERNERDIGELAASWAQGDPQNAASTLAGLLQEAVYVELRDDRNVGKLCELLAKSTDSPERWLDVFYAQQLPPMALDPFLSEIVIHRRPGWEKQLAKAFERQPLVWRATLLVLRDSTPPPDLLERALSETAQMPSVLKWAWGSDTPPPATRHRLLRHPDRVVALLAAVEEWSWEPEHKVRTEIFEDWRKAILRSAEADADSDYLGSIAYPLPVILKNVSALALDWIKTRLQQAETHTAWGDHGLLAGALKVLSTPEREHLIDVLRPEVLHRPILCNLVQRDPERYRKVIARTDLADRHLMPLAGKPDAAWAELAILALDAGYTSEEIAAESFMGMYSYGGSGREFWEAWDRAFAELEDHPSVGVRQVARHGRAEAKTRIQHAIKKDKRDVLRGV